MDNQLVTILRITKPQIGNFVKNRLESEGIEVFFTNEGKTIGSKYNPDEVLLKVKAGQTEKAIELLILIHKEYDLEKLELDSSNAEMKKILARKKLDFDFVKE